jgi:hypothetical protein
MEDDSSLASIAAIALSSGPSVPPVKSSSVPSKVSTAPIPRVGTDGVVANVYTDKDIADAIMNSTNAVRVASLSRQNFIDQSRAKNLLRELFLLLGSQVAIKNFGNLLVSYTVQNQNFSWNDRYYDILYDAVPTVEQKVVMDQTKEVHVWITPLNANHYIMNSPYFKVIGGKEVIDENGGVELKLVVRGAGFDYDVTLNDQREMYDKVVSMIQDVRGSTNHRFDFSGYDESIKRLTLFVYSHTRLEIRQEGGVKAYPSLRLSNIITVSRTIAVLITNLIERAVQLINSFERDWNPQTGEALAWLYWHLSKMYVDDRKDVIERFEQLVAQFEMEVVVDKKKTMIEEAMDEAKVSFGLNWKKWVETGSDLGAPEVLKISIESARFFAGHPLSKLAENLATYIPAININYSAPRDASLCSVITSSLELIKTRGHKALKIHVSGVDNAEFMNNLIEMPEMIKREQTRDKLGDSVAKAVGLIGGIEFEYTRAPNIVAFVAEGAVQLRHKTMDDVYNKFREPYTVHVMTSFSDFSVEGEKKDDGKRLTAYTELDIFNNSSVYVVRHTGLSLGEYKIISENMRIKGFATTILHHPRVTSHESFAIFRWEPFLNKRLAVLLEVEGETIVDWKNFLGVSTPKTHEPQKDSDFRAVDERILTFGGFKNAPTGFWYQKHVVEINGRTFLVAPVDIEDRSAYYSDQFTKMAMRICFSYALSVSLIKARMKRVSVGNFDVIKFAVSKINAFASLGAFLVSCCIYHSRKKAVGKAFRQNMLGWKNTHTLTADQYLQDTDVPTGLIISDYDKEVHDRATKALAERDKLSGKRSAPTPEPSTTSNSNGTLTPFGVVPPGSSGTGGGSIAPTEPLEGPPPLPPDDNSDMRD